MSPLLVLEKSKRPRLRKQLEPGRCYRRRIGRG